MIKLQKTRDWFLVIVVNFMWATQVPVIRLMGDRIGPMAIAFVPMLVSTIMFMPFLWVENKKRKASERRTWKDIRHFIVPGLIGIFLMQYLYTVGSSLTLASNAGIITLIIPVLVAIFASILLKEKLNVVRVIGFIIALAGVLLTSMPDIKGASLAEGGYLKGNLIFLLACACAAFFNTYSKVLIDKGFTELEILVYCSVVGSIACIPLLIWVEPLPLSVIMQSGTTVLLGLLELSLIVYGVSMLLFFYILKRMDVTQAILGNYLLPFFIALLGILLLNEKISLTMIIGGIIIFIGTLMVTVYENQLLSFFSRKNKNRPVKGGIAQKDIYITK